MDIQREEPATRRVCNPNFLKEVKGLRDDIRALVIKVDEMVSEYNGP